MHPTEDQVMAFELQRAVTAGALRVKYQPEIDLRTGRVTTFEALLQWRDPDYGDVPAELIVQLAEDFDLIGAVGGQL